MKLGLVIAFFFAFAQSQILDPPSNTKIRWVDVRPTSFKVTWNGPSDAFQYNANLYENFSTTLMRQYENITDEYLTVRGLKLNTYYAVQVQCVGEDGSLSKLGTPGRTKTFGVPTTTTTTTVAPSLPSPVGECGRGMFTCVSDPEECIDESWWCDGKRDCSDESDEQGCPGYCEEIVDFHQAGNFTCSRLNSPRSACFFQCNGDFFRRGAFYTVCRQEKWSQDIPTCVLRAPRGLVIVNDGVFPDALQFEFQDISSAESYVIEQIIDVSTGQRAESAVLEYNNVSENILSGIITGLNNERQYRFTIAAIDNNKVKGAATRDVLGQTAKEEAL